MALEDADAIATNRTLLAARRREAAVLEAPHANRLVERARNENIAARRESDGVDAIEMTRIAFGPLNHATSLSVPDTHALVETTGSNVTSVGRHGDGSNAVLDGESEDVRVVLEIPQANRAIAGSRGDVAAIRGEVQRVDILLVTGKLVANRLRSDVPDLGGRLAQYPSPHLKLTYSNDLIFGTSGKHLAVRTEAHASDVEVTLRISLRIRQVADLLTSVDIEDLGGAVATSCDVSAIGAESYAAHNALMRKVVNELDVQLTSCSRVEDGEPVITLSLQVRRKLIWIVLGQLVTDLLHLLVCVLEIVVWRLAVRVAVRRRRCRAGYTG